MRIKRLFRQFGSTGPVEGASTQAGPKSGISGRTALVLVALSILMLVPCFWQPRLQAGDLSSHIYNAWLAELIDTGRVQGLAVASQTTNLLFDLILGGLYHLVGAEAAQRIAVSLAVLIFVWGAFAFVSKVAGTRPWHLLVCIVMLAYGWVFHMGFFNFYLSLGLCFWALALAWDPAGRHWLFALPVLALAYVAHGLPVAWTACLLAYLWLARRIPPRSHAFLAAGSLLVMVFAHWVLNLRTVTRWSPLQIVSTTGVDQVWVFDLKYYFVLVGLLLMWGLLFLELMHRLGPRRVASSMAFQICIFSATGVFVMPSAVRIPGFQHSLVYIAERMSLGVGICVCALLGSARARTFVRYGLGLLALVFFGFLFHDERRLNSFEDRMQDTVARLQPGQRVVSGVDDASLRTPFAVGHMIDRVCIGRCFSYGNYEASTAQFRVRATAANPYVVFRYGDSIDIQLGRYVVKPSDLPLYKVDLENGRLVIRSLQAGVQCGMKFWNTLAGPPPIS
jgi:hypothetical protein